MATDWEKWKQAAVGRNYVRYGASPTGLYYHALILSTANRQKAESATQKVSKLRAEISRLNEVLRSRKREIAELAKAA